MKGLLYSIGRKAAPAILKTRWIYRSLTGTESEKIEAEYLMGCHLASSAIRNVTLVEDSQVTGQLRSTLERLCLTLVNRDRRFQIRCVQNPEPNAFALPGGFIFITDSLLELCGYDPDEIAFVLAHEMAHVIRSHSLNRLLASEIIQLFARGRPLQRVLQPAVKKLVQQIVTQGYSRRQEFEADRLASKMIRVAGFAPEAGPRLLERLMPVSGKPDSATAYFSSHPPIQDRIKRLQQTGSS